VLRGCILIELAFRGRIGVSKETRRRPLLEKIVVSIDPTPTGDVLLDEAHELIQQDSKQPVGYWVDLLSGETWNFMKMSYQLKQVRERVQKGLVDKGVLRTEKSNFIVFDMATHPLSNVSVKEDLHKRVRDCLLRRGTPPDRRMIAMVCAAHAATVLDNALGSLTHEKREFAFTRVDDLLAEYSKYTEKNAKNNHEIMAAVLQVFTKMDSLL